MKSGNNYKYLFLLLFLLAGCQNQQQSLVKDGKVFVDLKTIEPAKLELRGGWNFYWQKHIVKTTQIKPERRIKVPGTWRENYYFPNSLSPSGFGTYQCTIFFKEIPTKNYGLQFNDVNAAGEIWINGVKKATSGRFSKTKLINSKTIEPIIVPLPKARKINVNVPISMFHHRMGGGMLHAPILGDLEQLIRDYHRRIVLEGSSTLVIILISLISILIYLNGLKNKAFLYFGMMCLGAVLRQVVIDVGLLSVVFDSVPFTLIQTLRYIGFLLGVGFGAKYFYHLFPDKISRNTSNVILFTALGLSSFTIITYDFYASFGAIAFQIFGLVSILYVSFCLFKQGKSISKDQYHILITTVVFFVSIVFDLVNTKLRFSQIHLQSIGFLVFSVFQLINLSIVYKIQLREIRLLNLNLKRKEETLTYKSKDIDFLILSNLEKNKSHKEFLEDLMGDVLKDEPLDKIRRKIYLFKSQLTYHEKSKPNEYDSLLISSEFETKLYQKYPQLSKMEIELCILIRLNLTTKEIAEKRNTSLSSVKVAKHRIRKKLQVGTAMELSQLLEEL